MKKLSLAILLAAIATGCTTMESNMGSSDEMMKTDDSMKMDNMNHDTMKKDSMMMDNMPDDGMKKDSMMEPM